MAGSSSAAQTGTARPRADRCAGTLCDAQRTAAGDGSGRMCQRLRRDRKMGTTFMVDVHFSFTYPRRG